MAMMTKADIRATKTNTTPAPFPSLAKLASTLIMTLAGLGIGMGLVVAGVRRNRRTTIAA
jgi:hypothetical protein